MQSNWIQRDFKDNPHRFTLECIAWLLSVGGSAFFAVTNNHPNLLLLYVVWISGCMLAAWCAYLRGSCPNMLNYVCLALIDSVGLFNHLAGL